jgi:hypothetical protein
MRTVDSTSRASNVRLLRATLLLLPSLAFGQVVNNSVTVSASQSLQASQVTFDVTVGSGITTLSTILNAVSSVGITAADLIRVSSTLFQATGTGTNNIATGQLNWTFQLTVPVSEQKTSASSLAALAGAIGQGNSGLSLSYSIEGSTGAVPATNCDFASLIANARTQAQQLASTANQGIGTILGITDNSSSTLCLLTVKFAPGGTLQETGPTTVTVSATQSNPPPLDQVSIFLDVSSPGTAGLSSITGALSAAGITGVTLSGVNSYIISAPQSGLNWSFGLVAPFAQLSATLAQLSNAAVSIQQQNTGLSLTFNVAGLTSSQAQQPPSCANVNLLPAAQTRAQQIAAAAGLSLGPVLSLSEAPGFGNVSPAFVASGVGFLTLALAPPANPTCSLTAQFQLYN